MKKSLLVLIGMMFIGSLTLLADDGAFLVVNNSAGRKSEIPAVTQYCFGPSTSMRIHNHLIPLWTELRDPIAKTAYLASFYDAGPVNNTLFFYIKNATPAYFEVFNNQVGTLTLYDLISGEKSTWKSKKVIAAALLSYDQRRLTLEFPDDFQKQ